MQKRIHEKRYPSALCLSCINYAGDVRQGPGRVGVRCRAGVMRLSNRFECESYVRLFEGVPFLGAQDVRPYYRIQPFSR